MALPILLRLASVLLPFLVLQSLQALLPLDSPTLTLFTPVNTTTTANDGTRVPGISPFVYVGNPTNNLFQITTLDMIPNPCTLHSPCTLLAHGTFTQDIASLRLRAQLTSDFSGEPVTIFIIEDEFCDWVDMEQDGRESCPPKQGEAVVRYEAALMSAMPEAKYGIDLEVTAENGAVVLHVYADLQLGNWVRRHFR